MADPKAAPNPTEVDLAASEAQNQQVRIQSELYRPSPPGRYANLKAGPGLTVGYEPNQTTPVDGSDSLIRNLSPFVLQIEPPLVLASEPLVQTKGKPPTGLYRAAARQRSAFSSARVALAASSFIQSNVRGHDSSEDVPLGSNKSSGGARNRTGDGTSKVTAAGQTAGKLGEPSISDLKAATDVFFQLQAVLQTPPLVLLINPQSISINHAKIQQYSDRTRAGYVFQAWGEEQPKLSIEARCGAFISGSRGVQFASRRDSAAWQNLMTAFHLYRNNGYIYDTVGPSFANHFVGALSIRYDQWIYYGHMESFNWTLEEGTQLGGVTFSMEFTVSSMLDTAPVTLSVKPMKRTLGGPSTSGVHDPAFNPPAESSLFIPGQTAGMVPAGLRPEEGGGVGDPNKPPSTPKRTGARSLPSRTGSFQQPAARTSKIAGQAPVTSVEPFSRVA